MYYQVILVVHVLLGLGVIGLVLIQQGKGADAGAAFGSASSGSVFGAQGASSFLSRTTAILATLFFTTSLGLAVLSGYQEGNIDLMDSADTEQVVPDLPLINGAEISVPASDESIPVIQDTVPAELIDSVGDTVNNAVENISEQSNAVIDNTVEKTNNLIDSAVEQSQAVVNNAEETMLDTQQSVTEVLAPAVETEQP